MSTAIQLELLWVERKSVPRILRHPLFQAVTARSGNLSLPAPTLAGQEIERDERRDLLSLLCQGSLMDLDRIPATMRGATHEDGRFISPLVLVQGQLRLTFNDLDVLAALVANALPFVTGEGPLQAAVDEADELLRLSDGKLAQSATATMVARLKGAVRGAKLDLADSAPNHLPKLVEQGLLEQHMCRKQQVRGAPHLRMLLAGAGPSATLVYLPAEAGPHLPIDDAFPVRLIAEALPNLEEGDAWPHALRVLCIARSVVPTRSRAS